MRFDRKGATFTAAILLVIFGLSSTADAQIDIRERAGAVANLADGGSRAENLLDALRLLHLSYSPRFNIEWSAVNDDLSDRDMPKLKPFSTLEGQTLEESLERLVASAEDTLIPVLHNVTFEDVRQYSGILPDLAGFTTTQDSIADIAKKIAGAVSVDFDEGT